MRIVFLFVFLCGVACADDPIRLPEIAPAPTPAPAPGAVSKLGPAEWYVIDSDVPVIVLASPQGLVTVVEDSGPLKLRGKFVDGKGAIESRTYKGKHVFTVEAAKSGTVELLIVEVGKGADGVTRRSLDVTGGDGPRPPPKPDDPDPPAPTPVNTNPFSDPAFRVLITFDSGNTTRPAAQSSVLFGKSVREYLDKHCADGPAGEKDDSGKTLKEWRIWPANSDVSLARPVWRDAFAKKGAADWIMIGNGTKGYSGPLPASEAAALELIKKHGGE